MATVESAHDPMLTEPLALCVQFYDRSEAIAPDAELPEVFAQGEEEWVAPLRIAPFDSLAHNMWEWRITRPSTIVPGCTQLDDKHKAKPKLLPLDPKCPYLIVRGHLRRLGWEPTAALCDHLDRAIGGFDGLKATRMKPYLQVLIAIDRTMVLTSHIPSREPMSFYNALLKGLKVEPGEKDRHYQMLLHSLKKRKGEFGDPLPIEDVPEPAGDEVILALPQPPKSKRARGGPGPSRRADAKSSGSGGAHPPPLPPPGAPVGGPGPAGPPSPEGFPASPTPPAAPAPGPVQGEEEAEDEVIMGEPDDDEDGPVRKEQYDWQPGLDGAEILCMQYFDKKKGTRM